VLLVEGGSDVLRAVLDGFTLPRGLVEPVAGRLAPDDIVNAELVSGEASEPEDAIEHATSLADERLTEDGFLRAERFTYEEDLGIVRTCGWCVSVTFVLKRAAIAGARLLQH